MNLKKTIFLTLSLSLSTAINAGTIEDGIFNSELLGQEFNYKVYIPDATPNKVIYMLHGAGGSETDWIVKGGIQQTADALMPKGKLDNYLIVMPTIGAHSWYVDSDEAKTEEAIVNELIPYIEEKYSISPEKSNRAVAGLSMGGYGALNLALSHPELFCAAGIISPAIYDPLPPETSAASKAPPFLKDGEFSEEAWTQALYKSRLAHYRQKNSVTPMFIASGDEDFLNIVNAAAKLYWELNTTQPKDVEYRVIDGDHDWLTFRQLSLPALDFINEKCKG